MIKNFKTISKRDLLYLDTMLTPKVLTALYWLSIVFAALVAFENLYNGKFMMAIGVLIFGPLCARVCCELLIIWFKIYESIRVIAEGQKSVQHEPEPQETNV